MTFLAAPPPVRAGSITDAMLTSLANTCESAAEAAWIHDSAGRCVYRNARALAHPHAGAVASFELVDHHGTVIGRLHTAAA